MKSTPERPADDRAALQPPGQPERAVQAAAGPRRARAARPAGRSRSRGGRRARTPRAAAAAAPRGAAAPATSAARRRGASPGTSRSARASDSTRVADVADRPQGVGQRRCTAPASPYIARVLAVSWAATSAVPVKNQPDSVSPSAEAQRVGDRERVAPRGSARPARRAAGWPAARRPGRRSSARSRPTAAARSSSSRPLSSSARVCRPTRNMLISPATTAPKADACQVTWPPMVFSARAGPAMAMKAALSSMLAAARSNSAWVV